MPIATTSDSEQKSQRGLKRKPADSFIEYPSSPSGTKRRRNNPENLADPTEKEASDPTSSETSTPASDDQIIYRPDGKFYYEDGDIFLIVERTFFCVHAEQLRATGGIFEDLLSGDIRPSEDEFLYGLPALRVPLVSLRQFRFLLAYIYDAISLRKEYPDDNNNSSLYWEAAIELLDVSTKLNLHFVRKSAISALECLFPTDLIDGRIPTFQPIIAGFRQQSDEKMFYRTFPIKAIYFFHEHGVPSMLPMAYYHAAQLSLEDIVNGVECGDVVWKLNPVDMMKVLKGRDKLKTSRRQVLFPWLNDKMLDGPERGSATCDLDLMLNGNYCWENFMEIYSKFNRSGFLDDNTNGLQCLSGIAQDIFPEYVCHGCWSGALSEMSIGEGKNWTSLPGYFGFEGWDAVKSLQEDVDRGWEGDY